MKTSTARTVHGWLEQESHFRALAARVDRLVSLQAALAAACPRVPLTVMSVDDEELTVMAPTAAWAARLRQMEPSLRDALHRERLKIRRIRIVPQRRNPLAERSTSRLKTPPPPPALAQLERLRAEIEDSPLKEALTNLLRRHRG